MKNVPFQYVSTVFRSNRDAEKAPPETRISTSSELQVFCFGNPGVDQGVGGALCNTEGSDLGSGGSGGYTLGEDDDLHRGGKSCGESERVGQGGIRSLRKWLHMLSRRFVEQPWL